MSDGYLPSASIDEHCQNHREVLTCLAQWAGVPVDTVLNRVSTEDLIKSKDLLCPAPISYPIRLIRRTAPSILRILNPRMQWHITGAVKSLRGKLLNRPKPIDDWFHVRIIKKLQVFSESILRKGSICLTHDVDYPEGIDFLPELLARESHFGIKSTFHFLTNDRYKLEDKLLADIRSYGSEIGLHGNTHDAGLGLRRPTQLKQKLSESVKRLGGSVACFRAPALSLTSTLLEVIEELGLSVDSSLLSFSPYRQGVETCWPYRIPGSRVSEVPLTIQDDMLFRDISMKDEEALEYVVTFIDDILAHGGWFVFNGHPSVLRRHERFLDGFLGEVSRRIESVCLISNANKIPLNTEQQPTFHI